MPKADVARPADPLGPLAAALTVRLAASPKINARVMLRALHESLDGADDAARQARLSAQVHLANVADGLMGARPAEAESRMISTVEAATILACSRPYVAMLIDSGKLPGAAKTAGGHRKVPLTSVLAWKAGCDAPGDADYRAAGQAAGLYDVDERVATKAARRVADRARG